MDCFEDYSQGRSVQALGWPGSDARPKPLYDGYLAFSKKAYSATDEQRLHFRGLKSRRLEELGERAAPWRDLYGLLKPHSFNVYWVTSGTALADIDPAKVEEITDADDVLFPWCVPKVCRVGDEMATLIGLTGRGRWLKSSFWNYDVRVRAQGPKVLLPFRARSDETTLVRLERDDVAVPVEVLELAPTQTPRLDDLVDLRSQVTAWKEASLGEALDGFVDLLSKLVEKAPEFVWENYRAHHADAGLLVITSAAFHAGIARYEESRLDYDDTRRRFIPARTENLYYAARVYALDLERVPQVDRVLQERGYSTLSSKTRVLEMRSYAKTLDLLVWVVMAVVLTFGAWTISLVFGDVTSRKRGAIGILRIMGMPKNSVFGFVFVRALVVGSAGFVVGVMFGGILTVTIPGIWGADIRLEAVDFVWIFLGALLCSFIGVTIPAWHAARKLDPVDAILQSRIQ